MTIRRRALSTILVTTIVLVAVLYVVSRVIIMDGFSKVEASMMKRDVARVMSALQYEMSSLGIATRQWARRNGTSARVDDSGAAAVAGDLGDEILANLRLDAVLLLDSSGTSAGERLGLDRGRKKSEQATQKELQKIFDANASLTKPKDVSRVMTGVLLLRRGPFMFASRPIRENGDADSAVGHLILGRYLDSEAARRLSNMLRMEILFWTPGDPGLAGALGSLDLKQADPVSVRTHGDKYVEGFAQVLDPFGQPALIVGVRSTRGLYHVGQATANYFLFCLAMVGIIFAAVGWETLERGILVPLTRVIKEVTGIAERGTSSDRVTSQGHDEMSRLADAINSMLDALTRSEEALKEARTVLEQKVLERTAQLTETNERLTEEIETRRRAQEDLRESEERYRAVVDNQTELICRFSPDRRLTFVNDAYCRYFGSRCQDLIGKTVPDASEADPIDEATHSVTLPTKDNPLITYERQVKLKKGERRWQQWTDQAILDEKGEIVEFQSVGRDITELKASAREKECLLQEIHHRVKNNLQIMMSLLDLQTDYVDDPRSLEVFRDAEHRILSMALVHEHLYQSESFADVRAQDYVQDLVEELLCTYEIGNRTDLSVDAHDITFGAETAVPVGLIVSELVSNSLKHAFTGDMAGEIRVSIESVGDDEFELCVADNGVGFAAVSVEKHHESFGLYLVRSLVEQLHGKISIDTTRGTAFSIRFHTIRPKRSGWSNG